jgi:hypothetical protein
MVKGQGGGTDNLNSALMHLRSGGLDTVLVLDQGIGVLEPRSIACYGWGGLGYRALMYESAWVSKRIGLASTSVGAVGSC